MKRLKKKRKRKKAEGIRAIEVALFHFCCKDFRPSFYLIAYYTIYDKVRCDSILIVGPESIEHAYIEFISDLNTILIINRIK